MARTYDYNVSRSQDYLVNPGIPSGSVAPQQANSYQGNFSGGGGNVYGGAQRKTPDLSRQSYRAGERQIRENTVRPLDLSFIDADKNRAMDSVRSQGNTQLDRIANAKQGLNSFLPDLSKAVLQSDAGSTQKIADRLAQQDANFVPEKVSTNIQDEYLSLLKSPKAETYQSIYSNSRGGGALGVNRLDSLIAQRSGVALNQLNQKARELAGVNETAENYNRTINRSSKGVEESYDKTTDDIKNYLSSLEVGTKAGADKRVQEFNRREIAPEVGEAKNKAISQLIAENPNLRGFIENTTGLEQFFDRELSTEEAYSQQDVTSLNNIAKLLGKGDIYSRRNQDAKYNEAGLLEFLRKQGLSGYEKDKSQKEAASKAMAERAAVVRAQEEEKRRKEEEKVIRLNEVPVLNKIPFGGPKVPFGNIGGVNIPTPNPKIMPVPNPYQVAAVAAGVGNIPGVKIDNKGNVSIFGAKVKKPW